METETEQAKFELLRRAYIDSRYSDDFIINKEDLEWLAECVKKLQEITKDLCQKRIDSF